MMTPVQFQTMVDVIDLNPELISGRLTPSFRQDKIKKKWEALATLLNSPGLGPGKDDDKWRQAWRDQKVRIRAKATKIQQGAGSELSANETLTDLEKRVLNMIEPIMTTGVPDGLDDKEIIELKCVPLLSINENSFQVKEDKPDVSIPLPRKRRWRARYRRTENENISESKEFLKALHQQMEHQTAALKQQTRIMEDIAKSLQLIAVAFQNN